MNSKTVFLICVFSLCSILNWGQTWDLSETMTATLDGDGVLTFSTTAASEEMPDFERNVYWPWEDVRGEIKSVIIEDNVTAIGAGAFFNCWNLRSLSIANSVTVIKDDAFNSCHHIETVTLPNSVTVIGSHAFNMCWNLTDFIFPENIKEIGVCAFYECSELVDITIPASLTSIGNGAFGNCQKLEAVNVDAANPNYSSVDGVLYNKDVTELLFYSSGKNNPSYVIPNTVRVIDANACLDAQFTSITIPESVTVIGDAAFYKSSLQSVTIPKSLTGLGYKAFAYCSGLTSIQVEDGNEELTVVNGALFNKDQTLLIAYPAGKSGDFTVPATVERIEGLAFPLASGLSSVTIPNSVMSIGEAAFSGCSGLTSVTIPNSVVSIESGPEGGAFRDCTGLASITIPGSVIDMGLNIFNGCTGLKVVTVEWETPYPIPADNDIFWGVNKSEAMLRIPEGTKALYEAAHSWGDFGTIVEYDLSGNEVINSSDLKVFASNGVLYVSGFQPGENVCVYTLSGQLVHKENAKMDEVKIRLNMRGIYVVAVGNQSRIVIIF